MLGEVPQAKGLEAEMPFPITIPWIHFFLVAEAPASSLQSNISRTQVLQRGWCHWGHNYKGNGGYAVANRWVWGRIACSDVWSLSRG